jgi:hypothetical protein
LLAGGPEPDYELVVTGELQRRGVAGDRSAVAVDADLLAGAGRDWADLVAGKWLSPFGEQLAEGEGDVFPGFDVDDACGVVGVQRGDQMPGAVGGELDGTLRNSRLPGQRPQLPTARARDRHRPQDDSAAEGTPDCRLAPASPDRLDTGDQVKLKEMPAACPQLDATIAVSVDPHDHVLELPTTAMRGHR